MKNLHSLSIMLLFSLLTTFALVAQNADETTKSPWKLIWNDEFNGKQLKKTNWNILTRETSKHDELQFYIPGKFTWKKGTFEYEAANKTLECSTTQAEGWIQKTNLP